MNLLPVLPPPPAGKTGWPWTEQTDPAIYTADITYPKISIVMPTYNQGQYIEESIRSLLLQNYPNLEFIIMDGGSTDETVSIIKKYAPWINFWVSGKDGGQSSAINMGLAKCTGEWFNWLNSDDYLLPSAFFYLMDKVMKVPGEKPVAVCGDKKVITMKGELRELDEIKMNLFYKDFIGMGYYQAAALYAIDTIRMFGGVDEKLHFTMDIKLAMQVNLVGKIQRVDKHIMVARTHEASKGSQAAKFHDEWIKAFAALLNYFPEEYRNEKLIAKIEKVTGISFKRIPQTYQPTRFTAEEYKFAQLYMGERIIYLLYTNHKKGVGEMVRFYKKEYFVYYKQTILAFTKFKTIPVIQFGIRMRNWLFYR